jgi:hypothetical protein
MDTIREGDVFRFRYSDTTKRFMPYHCFDGQLIAFKQPDGSLLLRDTYWLHACPDFKERSDTRTFTEAEAREQGELAFVCNLGQTDRIEKYALPYYDEADVFDLSHQHGCYPYFALRKGAEKSPDKIRRVIGERIAEARRKIELAEWDIKRMTEFALKVEAGELSEVYL